jgi:PAS domain S-box-containing protein
MSSDHLTDHELRQMFPGDSELAGLMRTLDWSKTDLGSPKSWPSTWLTAVSLCLTSRIPIVLYLGAQYTVLYNDPYISFLGETKHPRYLGRPGRECWQEIWDTIGPMLASVYETAKATWSEDVLMFFARKLPLEEVYVRFTFGPILRPDGSSVDGIFCPCTETTERVVGARRLETLRKLGVQAAEARTVASACESAASVLAENHQDIPFAAIYTVNDDGQAQLNSHTGFPDLNDPLPLTVAPADNNTLSTVLRTRRSVYTDDLSILTGHYTDSDRTDAPNQIVVLPIAAATHETLSGLLVVAINPRRVLDDAYRAFFDLVAGHIGTAISDAQAYESEKRRAEALAELDRAKTAFFSNVSHEFRTPLTLMLGPVEDLLSRSYTDLPPSAKGQLEVVNRNGLRLLRLVNTLLDFSRIEAGRVQASYEPTDLAAFTTELASSFRSAIERAGLKLIVDCPPITKPVYVDRDMWEKVVLNLLSNAFKFTFEGQIRVVIRQGSDSVELHIRDTGVGIPAEALPRLFERFYRVEDMRSRTHEGSGIGLALVQELVKLHAGSVRVESLIGEGSTFIVTLPLGTAHLPTKQIGARHNQLSTATGAAPFVEEALRWLPDLTGEQASQFPTHPEVIAVPCPPGKESESDTRPVILIADDNADMRHYIARLLAERYCIEQAPDGEAALSLVRTRRPDLILSDVMMPRLDGIGLLQALRNDQTTKTIPLILLSARAGEEARIEGLEHGADDYLIKPFSARELMARVQAHLDLARVRKEAEQEIARSKYFLERLADTTPDLLWVYDIHEGKNVYINRSVGTVLGYGVEEFQRFPGDLTDAVVHPDDLPAIRDWYDGFNGSRDREIRAIEIRVRHADGSYRWLLTRGSVFEYDPGGRVKQIVGVATDITDRKQAEDALRKSEQHLELKVTQRTADLLESQDRLRGLATELNLAEQRERKRMAGELHDHLAQMLVLASMKLKQAKRGPGTVELIKQAEDALSECLAYTRNMVAELSPRVLYDFGLASALRWLGEQMRRYHLDVRVRIDVRDDLKVPEEQAVLLFQSSRELLLNVAKHAEVKEATITLISHERSLTIVVRDESGFDLAAVSSSLSSKFGLFSIRERMKALGGQFDFESAPGQGTTATLSLPFPAIDAAVSPSPIYVSTKREQPFC